MSKTSASPSRVSNIRQRTESLVAKGLGCQHRHLSFPMHESKDFKMNAYNSRMLTEPRKIGINLPDKSFEKWCCLEKLALEDILYKSKGIGW